ncbi:ABC-three component system middle component 6 [Ornithinibacillus californiensis]|uniref:ABC-three component system middle component 6 n=1 Tax=Ornithinibacillus californiensis TaxID=161536 RepID=UPI00064DD391|nr:ABC-three component system middle component 6 [Ornithinibacillus californiensis]
MILPQKHIKLSESLFGLGGFILGLLDTPKNVDRLWEDFIESVESNSFPTQHSFDNFILALDYLYIIGLLDTDKGGRLIRCD